MQAPLSLRRTLAEGRGFTLLEMLVVMVLLGLIMGIGVDGFDRMDPGYGGLQSTVSTFIESSRERARSSGKPVLLVVADATKDQGQRLQRFVFRSALEATFEPRFQKREGLQISGDAALGVIGRYGAGADLERGGVLTVHGRGLPHIQNGFSLEFDFLSRDGKGGQLLSWDGLLHVVQRKNGVLEVSIRARGSDEEMIQEVRLETLAAVVNLGSWQHFRLTADDGKASLVIDGREVAQSPMPSMLAKPQSALRFGADRKGWSGVIDELNLWARVLELGPEMPTDVRLEIPTKKVYFNRFGLLHPDHHVQSIPLRILALDEEVASFSIGTFTEEVGL